MLIIGVSLKTYMSIKDTINYIEALKPIVTKSRQAGVDFFVVPDMVSLGNVGAIMHDNSGQYPILAAQDCFWEDNGPYTGTISPKSLAELGVKIVEIGHAERRDIFHETDAIIAKKAQAAVRNGLVPLLCIGEEIHGNVDDAIATCVSQLRAVTSEISSESELIVAYEPIWAIGKEKPADSAYVNQVTAGIKQELTKRKGISRVIYGGSAGPGGLFQSLYPNVDGLFLGRFGHSPTNVNDVLIEIIECAKYTK